MAKFTAKHVREGLSNSCEIFSLENLTVEGNEGQTFANVTSHLLAASAALDTALVFESKFPAGIEEIVDGYVAQWEALRVEAVALNPEAYVEWAELFGVYPAFAEPDEDPAFEGLDIDAPHTGEEPEPVKPAKKEKPAKNKASVEDEVDEEVDEDEEDEEVDEEEVSDEDLENELDEVLDEEFEDEVLAEEAEEEVAPVKVKGSKTKKNK